MSEINIYLVRGSCYLESTLDGEEGSLSSRSSDDEAAAVGGAVISADVALTSTIGNDG